jgi:hypothetical protein
MNIPQRLWRVVRGRILLTRQRRSGFAEAAVAEEELAALTAAARELAEQTVEPARAPADRVPARASAPPAGPSRRDPLAPYFRTLKLAPGADLAALEQAYQRRLAEIHPELHPVGSPPREAAEGEKAVVVEAYERLRDAINVTETRFEKLELDPE